LDNAKQQGNLGRVYANRNREQAMLRFSVICAAGFILVASISALAQQGEGVGAYRVLNAVKAGGGAGGFDYVSLDTKLRRIYIARGGEDTSMARIMVFDLDTLKQIGEIPNTRANGVTIDTKTNHGFASSNPVLMFDSKTLQPIRTIGVQAHPDGMFFDELNQHIYILSHGTPNVTVLDSRDGSILRSIDLGGMPDQMVSDGRGHLYTNLLDKASVVALDANKMEVMAHYGLDGKGGQCPGIAMDVRNRVLFSACRNPQNMVMLDADSGQVLAVLPIGWANDGAAFIPSTMEAFSANADGTLTVIKENSRTDFAVVQVVQTTKNAKTLALDPKTNHLILIGAEYIGTPPGTSRTAPPGSMVPGTFTILVVGK
jgi:DNA-binding beta-propeller fold protein YncE